MSIIGKLQVVTGGTSGMGFATALRLGEYGPVLIGGRGQSKIDESLAKLKEAGVEAYGMSCDISDRASVEAFKEYAKSLGAIGSVCNAAGVYINGTNPKMILDINMGGVINVTEAFLSELEDGVMCHYSSCTGYLYDPTPEVLEIWEDTYAEDFFEKNLATIKPPAGTEFLGENFPFYAASKRFVMYYTMANAERFGAKGNRIFSIAPGSFDTPMLRAGYDDPSIVGDATALGRVGTPEEMADLVVKLMGPGPDYLTGCDVRMDGGCIALTQVPQID